MDPTILRLGPRLWSLVLAAALSGAASAQCLGDAVVSALSAPSSANPGTTVTVTYNVCNIGPCNFFGSWNDRVYLSSRPSTAGTVWSALQPHSGTIFPGNCYSNIGINTPVPVPIPSNLSCGTYYIGYAIDVGNVIPEVSNSNNTKWIPIQVGNPPDFTITAITSTPTLWQPGVPVAVNVTVANLGCDAGNGPVDVDLFLSPTTAPSGPALATTNAAVVAGGATAVLSATFTAPSVANGCYFLVGFVNPRSVIPETDRTNNTASIPLGVTPPAAVTRFGSGCAGRQGVPTSTPVGLPILGSTGFAVDVGNVPAQRFVVLALGASNTASSFGALPLDLTRFGMAGCTMLVSPDTTMAQVSAGSVASFALPVPDASGLLGQAFYCQAWVLDPGSTSLGFIVSDGLACTVGK